MLLQADIDSADFSATISQHTQASKEQDHAIVR
jgi:hypothetical protein